MVSPRGQHQNGETEKQDGLITEGHSSSSVCSCKSFLFHQNGTASGFIKIYELNHHWKYKTLVGEQGEAGEEGKQAEREKKRKGWCDEKKGVRGDRMRGKATESDRDEERKTILVRTDV